MKTTEIKPPAGYLCVRCEAKNCFTQAEVFVEVDGLLDNCMHPMCLKCKREWDTEYNSLMYSSDFDL